MAQTTRSTTANQRRLNPRPTEIIRRDKPVHFRFNGKRYTGYEGDTISAALWANGVRVISRSFKYHRPRGDFALDGSDPNALVQIGDEPNVCAGKTLIREGMAISPQNVTPSLDFDLMSINGALHRFLPVGFYYKAFHSKWLWPFYEKVLRRVAGLGRVDPHSPQRYYDKQYKHADVLVVGGGPAGLNAALAAAQAGAKTLLIEQERFLGGHLRFRPGDLEGQTHAELATQLARQVEAHKNVEVLRGAVAMGFYSDHWVPAFTDERLYKIRGAATVVATGALERTLVFSNNDLPGILLGSAAARLLNLYAVRPGENALVVSANDDGLRLALDLRAADINVTVAEERAAAQNKLSDALQSAGVSVHWRHTVSAAHGKRQLSNASLLPLNADGNLSDAPEKSVNVDCDTMILSLGYAPNAALLYQSHAKLAWDDATREMLPAEFPKGVHAAGRVCGSHGLETALLEGRIAGANAAADAGFASEGSEADVARLESLKSHAKPLTSKHYRVPGPGKFRFVDFAEDVTEKDVHDAIAEGYDSVELLKRYTTLSMGPDQGRYSSLNGVLLAAELNRRTVQQTGTTTSRPPSFPIKMGVLGGRLMEPLRRTPLHRWHEEYGCTWLNAGQWKRAESYRAHSPEDEVRNVRRNVGIIDVSPLGKVFLYGKDVPELLSRLYTNKWRKLALGKARYGVMCNEEGILVDDGVSAHLDEGVYYMTLTTGNSSVVPETILWWQQSGWNLDVHFVNVTSQHAAINVAGPKSRELLRRLGAGVDLSNEAFPYMSARSCPLAGVEALLLRIGFTGELSYEIHCPSGYAEHVWTQLLEHGKDLGVLPFGLEAQRILRLEKGHLIVGQDTDALSTPLEADLNWTIKLDKEDFLGKVALLRKEKKGLTQALVGFELDKSQPLPPEGNPVVAPGRDGQLELRGRVTSARLSPTLNKIIGLAWVPHERRTPGSEIMIRIEGQLHRARVVTLPFYDPEGKALRS